MKTYILKEPGMGNEALAKLESSVHFGKIVIRMS